MKRPKKQKKSHTHPEFIIWRRFFPSGNAAVVFVAAVSFIIWLGEGSRRRLSGGRRFHSDTYGISINYLEVQQFFSPPPQNVPLKVPGLIQTAATYSRWCHFLHRSRKDGFRNLFCFVFFLDIPATFSISRRVIWNWICNCFASLKARGKKNCISHQMSFSFIQKKDNLIRRHPTREKRAGAAFKSVSLINE